MRGVVNVTGEVADEDADSMILSLVLLQFTLTHIVTGSVNVAEKVTVTKIITVTVEVL